MFTSLNVVRMAAVDCDCTRRSATRWRRRDIGTRCSVRDPEGIWIEGAGFGAFANGCCVTVEAAGEIVVPIEAGAAGAARMSAFVMRPSRPLPWTLAVSTPFSAAIFAAEGDAAFAAAPLEIA